jgi:hypothetical protein
MSDLQTDSSSSFRHLDLQEKRDYLRVLCDVVWDIETELAQAKAERAALMSSLQTDMEDDIRWTAPRPPEPTAHQEPLVANGEAEKAR